MPLQILDINGHRVVRVIRKAPSKESEVKKHDEEPVRQGADPGDGSGGDLPGRRRAPDQPLS